MTIEADVPAKRDFFNLQLADLRESYDVVIVGGGMVGLSLLQLLVKHLPTGRVCLLESHAIRSANALTQPSFDERSTALSAGSMTILRELGLWQSLAPRVTTLRQVHVSDRGHGGLTRYTREMAGEDLGCVVDNTSLGRCLMQGLEHSTNIDVVSAVRVNQLRHKHNGVEIEVRSKEEENATPSSKKISSQLIIIADGARSNLRQQLGIGVDRFDYQQSAVIANVSYVKAHQGVAYERFTANGPLALLPLGQSDNSRTSALVWTHPQSAVEQVLQWSDDEFLKQLQVAFGYRLGKFTKVGARAHFPLELVCAKEQVRSSVVLMGNAAHYLHPVAGQGFNLALRDCVQLVGVLRKAYYSQQALGTLPVLQQYLALQEKDQWLTTNLSHSFNRLFSSRQPFLQALRNGGLLGLEICPPLKKVFFNQMMGKGLQQIQLL